jgi:hypothetical protein
MCGWRKVAAAGAAAALLGALAWVYGTALAAPAVGTFHDDGLYAVTAKALATGDGYRIASLPGAPAQTKYPFLFPALLAAVWHVFPRFPENALWLKLVPFACALAWGLLTYRWLRQESASARVAWSLAGLLAVSPWVLFLATTLLSETLFATFVTAALLLLGRVERGAGDWKTVMGTAVLASGAFLARTAGVAVIGAGILVLLIRAGWRRAAVFLLISVVLCAPWIGWQMHRGSFEPYYSAVNYTDWTVLFHFALNQKVRIVSQNLVAVLLSPAVLMGASPTGWGTLFGMAAATLVMTGFVRRLRSGLRAPEILTAVYGTLIVCWAWPPMRFLAPLLPLLLLYGYQGVMALCQALHAGVRRTRWVLAGVAFAVILPAGWTLAAMTAVARETGAVIVPNTAYDDWREVMRLASWLKQNTAPDAVLMGNLDPVFYLYTGRRGVRGFVPQPYRLHYDPRPGDWPVGTPADLLQTIDRVRAAYLVCTPNLAFREGRPLARLTEVVVGSHPERFRLLYQSRDVRYRVYRITRSVDSPHALSDPPNLPKPAKLLASN